MGMSMKSIKYFIAVARSQYMHANDIMYKLARSIYNINQIIILLIYMVLSQQAPSALHPSIVDQSVLYSSDDE